MGRWILHYWATREAQKDDTKKLSGEEEAPSEHVLEPRSAKDSRARAPGGPGDFSMQCWDPLNFENREPTDEKTEAQES